MSIINILYTNRKGTTHFRKTLLEDLELGRNKRVRSTLQNINVCRLSDSNGLTLLHFAAKYGNNEFALYLISTGADVNAQTYAKETPLMIAIDRNHEKIVQSLLQAKADMYSPDTKGKCILGKVLNSAQMMSRNIGKILLNNVTVESLRNSVHVSSPAFHRDCALYHFLKMQNPKVTKILLEKGSPINAKYTKNEETVLFRAIEQLDVENVRVLVKYGGYVSTKVPSREPPVKLLLGSEYQIKVLKIVKLLINAGVTFVFYLPWILKYCNKEIIRKVIGDNIDFQRRDENGQTPIHYLAANKFHGVLEELSGFNINIHTRCNNNRTMLHYAARVSNASSVRFLIERGANVNARDCFGETPLGIIFDYSYTEWNRMSSDFLQNKLAIVDLLLERDIDERLFIDINHPVWRKIFRFDSYTYDYLLFIEPVLSNLAIVIAKCNHQLIQQSLIRRKIDSHPQLERHFYFCNGQLQIMKLTYIDEFVTLFDFSTASNRDISLYARNKRFVPNYETIMNKCNLNGYYKRRLKRRLLKVAQLVHSTICVEATLDDIFKKFCIISIPDIVKKIVSMLPDDDLCRMA